MSEKATADDPKPLGASVLHARSARALWSATRWTRPWSWLSRTASSTRLYGKVVRRTNNLKAHDESNSAGVGDRVLLMETRPLSKSKRWRLVEILEKAK